MALDYNTDKLTVPSFNEVNSKLDIVQGFITEVEVEKEKIFAEILKLKELQKADEVKLESITDTFEAANKQDETGKKIKVFEKQLDYLNTYLIEKTGQLFKECIELSYQGISEVKGIYDPYTLVVNCENADKTDAVANKLNEIIRKTINRFNQLLDATGHFDPLSTVGNKSEYNLKQLDMVDGAVILYGHQIKKLIGGY